MTEFIDIIDKDQFIEIALPGIDKDVILRLVEHLIEICVINFKVNVPNYYWFSQSINSVSPCLCPLMTTLILISIPRYYNVAFVVALANYFNEDWV